MKVTSSQLTIEQKDKLADFLITVAAGWFGAAVTTPFFFPPELTFAVVSRTIAGGIASLVFLSLALVVIEKRES